MNRELITSEAYATAIIESSDDAILLKDLDGVIRFCNPATEHIFGYAPEELVGQPVRVLIPDERQAEEDEILQRLRRGERVRHFDTVRITKHGLRIDVSLTISPVRGPSGVVIGASKIARDITAQKRAQIMQASLAAIVESCEDAVLAKDLNGTIQSCNPSAERLFDYSASELIGQSIRVLIPPDRQAEEDEILARVRGGERIRHFETVRMTKSGEALDLSLSVSPIRDASGAIVGVAKIARDITEQRRLARELAVQQEWFRVTLASIGDGVIASDPEGRVTYLNAEAAALTGWFAEEVAGRALTDVFPLVSEKTGEPVESPVTYVIRSGHVSGLAKHTVLIRRDGTQRPIADSAAPIRDHTGRIIGVVLVFRDVTEEREAEEALITASRAKDEFLAVLAHELRNPIAPIVTALELLKLKGPATPELQKLRNVIDRQTKQLVRLVDDLLDVGRIVSGKLLVERERVDLTSIVKQAAEMCLPSIEQRGQTLELGLPDRPVHIEGDFARIVQVVSNILGNATKYTADGGRIELTLSIEYDRALIRVRDNGFGISPDMLARIFDRFVQIDTAAHRRRGGFGLGLALVKAIVELHDGTVEARSEGFGRGSEFIVGLPLALNPT